MAALSWLYAPRRCLYTTTDIQDRAVCLGEGLLFDGSGIDLPADLCDSRAAVGSVEGRSCRVKHQLAHFHSLFIGRPPATHSVQAELFRHRM